MLLSCCKIQLGTPEVAHPYAPQAEGHILVPGSGPASRQRRGLARIASDPNALQPSPTNTLVGMQRT